MANVGLIYDTVFLRHETGFHPENPARVEHTFDHLSKSELFGDLLVMAPRPATVEEITLAHSKGYYETIGCLGQSRVALDPDTIYGPGTFEAAINAVGAVITALERIGEGKVERAFCLVRPPGHHARIGMSMGFCIFNNVAVGAKVAREKLGMQKVAIIDFDVHHGNGTQEIFYEDEDVLYCSIHQYPFYPGTGSREEKGTGKGLGKTLNVPLPCGSSEKDYLTAFEDEILPAVEQHRPQVILLSAGFDAHRRDPIGGMNLESHSFERITDLIVNCAQKVCKGRIVSVLEGGYDLAALATSIEAHMRALLK